MSSDTIQLSEVTDKALFYWLKKARNEGLTAMEAACLAYDFIPPKNATSSWRLPEHIESLYEKIDRYTYNSIIYEKQYKDWEKSLKLGFFGTSPEYIYTFDTIKQAINDADLGFIPKLIQLESTNNDENLCINVVNDSNIIVDPTFRTII